MESLEVDFPYPLAEVLVLNEREKQTKNHCCASSLLELLPEGGSVIKRGRAPDGVSGSKWAEVPPASL